MSGEQFVYFHGEPGSPEELRLFDPGPWLETANLFAPVRAHDRPDLPLGPYLDHLAAEIARRYPDGPIRLVGFSLGAFVALEIALRLGPPTGGRALHLDLISAAAPLDLGDFLPRMAGGAVFSLARRQPRLFAGLTGLQGALARLAPGLLFDQIFAAPKGADAALARDPGFRSNVQRMIAHSLAQGAKGYSREIAGYVGQPAGRQARLNLPMTLWQGDADTWTPPDMARALVAARPEMRRLRVFPGLSHYSTLKAALPEIFAGPA